jgi:hypothetical protein
MMVCAIVWVYLSDILIPTLGKVCPGMVMYDAAHNASSGAVSKGLQRRF